MTKILIVEDDKSLREIYGVRLLAEGYDIISAGDGEEALAVAIKDRPALIVSDVMMPKISGFDMLDILRSTTETRDIKVIMMTALSGDEQRERGESLGADRYLVKSQVGIEDVVRTVHEVLGDTPTVAQAPVPAPVTQTPVPNRVPTAASTISVPGRDTAPAAPANQAPAPTPQPITDPMPQPTAPFSTPRPSGVGDRVIQPLTPSPDENTTTLADQMNQELGADSVPQNSTQAPQQTITPATQPPINTTGAPNPVADSGAQATQPPTQTVSQLPDQSDEIASDGADLASHLQFEETPRGGIQNPVPPSPQPPQTPPTS